MTDADWGNLDDASVTKPGTPRWLLFCGCGCLVFILIAVAVGFWGAGFVKDASDSDLQWTKLSSVLEFEERPESHKLTVGFTVPFVDIQIFVFEPTMTGVGGVILGLPSGGDGDEYRSDLLDVEMNPGSEERSLVVQGRELVGLRTNGEGTAGEFNWGGNSGQEMIVLELSEEDDKKGLFVMIFAEHHNIDELEDDDIRRFLAPFKIGPDPPSVEMIVEPEVLPEPEEGPESQEGAEEPHSSEESDSESEHEKEEGGEEHAETEGQDR
ncbi:MAG: hypothetical protein ACI841_000823 [Planctomycetota bacterium]|jgi:hypothetical protein